MEINSICKQCGLYQYSSHPKIKGKGSSTPKLVLIGEAPGQEEANQNEVFVGRAGKKLHSMLLPYYDLGIYITNAVKCFPPLSTLNPTKGFRVPTLEEISICSAYLMDEIDKFNPTPVLMPMGNTALYAVTLRKNGISQFVGFKFFYTLNGKQYCVIPNYHPSYVLRNPKKEADFIKVMELAKEYINVNSGTTRSS